MKDSAFDLRSAPPSGTRGLHWSGPGPAHPGPVSGEARQSETEDLATVAHTFVVSDLHLTTAEPPHPRDKFWRRYKQREFFIDEPFAGFLRTIHEKAAGQSVELVLAGDIFDFDGVTELPGSQGIDSIEPRELSASWLEKKRGLNAEEPKSLFKIRAIIHQHRLFFDALGEFVRSGGRAIFIIGNHDLELHWPSVQDEIRRALQLEPEEQARVRFNNWFYISNGDTLIEHGNQHDSHSNCQNPINPRIRGLNAERIRMPFGCLAHRYMINGMGYFNPHSDKTYVMGFLQYVAFYVKHVSRKEPLLLWTWFWSAIITLLMTLKEGVAREVKNPLLVEEQVEEIAARANATPRIVRLLMEIHAPPAFHNPVAVAHVLWLDRAFLTLASFFVGFQLLSLLNIVWPISYAWTLALGLLLLPFFIFFSRSVKTLLVSEVGYYKEAVGLCAQITGTRRVIFGHTHEFAHTNFDGIEFLNSGTWSPAFLDAACTKPSSPKTFIWIRPAAAPKARIANVYSWVETDLRLLC